MKLGHLVAYQFETFNNAIQNYSTYDGDLYAIV